MKGVGKIVLDLANGSAFRHKDALYVLRIKKEILLAPTLSRVGLVVKFVDDRCAFHELSSVETVVASSLLCCGLYKLYAYEKGVEDVACDFSDLQAVLDA